MTNAVVVVLLSTYNGEHYLQEQLDSLLQQTFPNIQLVVRDDGSTDNTLEILKQYTAQHPRITLLEGTNIGVVKSFTALLKHCPTLPQVYYAFCDQDDVWHPDKLAIAVKHLATTPTPDTALYCSRFTITNQHKQPIGLSAIPRFVGFENALVENVAQGCTQVFGETIRQLLLKANPEHMMMHDWWTYLVASAFGTVVYDPQPTIDYRQHARNTVGWDKNLTSMLRKSTVFLDNLMVKRNGLQSLNQARHFLHSYPELPTEKQEVLIELLRLKQNSAVLDRYKFMMQHAIKRNNPIENLILTLTLLAGLH